MIFESDGERAFGFTRFVEGGSGCGSSLPLRSVTAPQHIPVLADLTLAALAPVAGDVVLDCTAGLGGHAAGLAAAMRGSGHLVLLDLDRANLAVAEARVREAAPGVAVHAVHANFASAPFQLQRLGLQATVLLADLGFCSNQVDDAQRGLSFMRDGPLDMRLNQSAGMTAAQFVASATADELRKLIAELGEDRNARRIATAIVDARRVGPISTTGQLAEIIRQAVGRAYDPIDPATRTFQALRIAVNDELGNLDALLDSIKSAAAGQPPKWLAPGARVGIISFHSLEDRPVKQVFTKLMAERRAVAVGDQPQTASEDEIRVNPRSRSAKLRVLRLGPVE